MDLTVHVGIDFGTSTTKIAYHSMAERLVKPIYFNHALESSYYPEYCLPSVACFDSQGKLLLGIEAARFLSGKNYHDGIHRIKMLLAGRYAEEFRDANAYKRYKRMCENDWVKKQELPIEVLTVFYLTYAMRLAKRTLLTEYPEDKYSLKIIYHVGMPVHHFQMAGLRAEFERVLVVAQWLEEKHSDKVFKELPSLERQVGTIHKRIAKAKYDAAADATRVFLTPEIEAQIKSYRFSSARTPGLHALVDIGAGTTDITILNLRNVKERYEAIEVFAWLNIPFGASQMEDSIAAGLRTRRNIENIFHSISNVQKGTNEAVAISKKAGELWNRTKPVWEGAYYQFQEAGYSVNTDWLASKVRVLLCGGGSQITYIQRDFACNHMEHQSSRELGRHRVESLPRPQSYGDQAPFWRMAVAFGLAQSEAIGNFSYEPPPFTDQLPNVARAEMRGDFDGDKLLPKPGFV